MKMKVKNFKEDFFFLYEKLKRKETFAYTRYSDGSLYVLQNKKLVLAADHFQIGDKVTPNHYFPEDYKLFDPEIHQFYRQKLIEAYQYKDKEDFYVGISCRCCVGDTDHNWMLDLYYANSENRKEDAQYLTWANIWVNGNFPLFEQYMIPEFQNHKIIYVVNEKADLTGLPFEVIKDFRVGHNCFVNNYGLIEEVKTWIKENKITDHVFLFSAADLSNVMIHQLFDEFDDNTYLNIGTALNNFLPGMQGKRGYLVGANRKECIW